MKRFKVKNTEFDPAGREPEGSFRWIERRVVMMQGCYDAIDRRWQDFWSVMKSLVSTRAWETYPVGAPWSDCETMLREVLGEEPENVLRSIAKIPEAAELGQYVNGLTERQRAARAVLADTPAAKPDGKRGKHGDAPSFRADQHSSTSAARIAARLKRDHPEIAEAAARGEYPSMRAAGIAAGIVRVPSLHDQMMKLWHKADEAERAQFLASIEARA